MTNLESLLLAEIDTLQSKMYKCKTIHLRYSMTSDHRDFLRRYSILGIYAEWEGFLKKSIALYLQEINRENLSFSALHENYISYQTDNFIKFKQAKTDFKRITKLSNDLYRMYQEPVIFDTSVNTESNANLSIANSILEKLCLEPLDESYQTPLNKLLRFRNAIAHGEEGIPVTQKDVDSFTLLVQNLAADIFLAISKGYQDKVYLVRSGSK
jgi:hypothetical protein